MKHIIYLFIIGHSEFSLRPINLTSEMSNSIYFQIQAKNVHISLLYCYNILSQYFKRISILKRTKERYEQRERERDGEREKVKRE